MIVFGNPTLLQSVEDKVGTNFVVFNFNELVENVQSLNYLNPYFGAVYNTNNSVFVNEQAFDQWYINYLTTNSSAFRELIDLLRYPYNCYNVYIFCKWDNEVSINMIEALIKFIVDNYGYSSSIVKTIDDIQNIKSGNFSIEGIQKLDSNLETYMNFFGTRNLPSYE